jgi:2-keto-4-pentenoate hydratase
VDIACDDLAARQYGDYRRGTPGSWFAEDHPPLSLEQAYAVQTEVARLRARDGSAVAGYKLGCIGARVREQFGMDGPIRGFLYADELHRSGAAISCARHANLAIEGEMALRLGEDGAIAAAFPIVELHNYVYRGPKPTLAELIANNGLNAGVVLPDKEPALADAGPLDATELEITLNGTLLERGPLWASARRRRRCAGCGTTWVGTGWPCGPANWSWLGPRSGCTSSGPVIAWRCPPERSAPCA